MDHRGVRYTIRTGIEPDQWTLVVNLPRGTIEKRVQSTKRKADETACAIIDKWLEKNGPQGGENSN
jgi:hypothetical protein